VGGLGSMVQGLGSRVRVWGLGLGYAVMEAEVKGLGFRL
jgi:hypothetical protein